MAKGDRFRKRVERAGPLDVTVLASCVPQRVAPIGDEDLAELFRPTPREAIEDIDLDEHPPEFSGERRDLLCGECKAPMELRKSSKYPTPFYGCSRFPECRGTHGARKDGSPLGTPADKDTKKARIRAHAVFDQIWKKHLTRNRGQAYNWMRQAMGLTHSQAHIGMFTAEQCEELIRLVYRDYPDLKDRIARLLYDDLFEDTPDEASGDEEPGLG